MALAFSMRSGALPTSASVAGFRGSEGLSRPYVFDVYVTVAGDHDLEPEEAIGSRATLTIDPGVVDAAVLARGLPADVSWGGILASVEMVKAIPGNTLYLARLVPRLWLLSLTKHSRVFTKKSIPEIITAVLEDEGLTDYELRLSSSYEVEEHVCQYRESSLDFIHRWMEREGLYYFFEQSDDGEKLVIVDSLERHDAVAHGPVGYRPLAGSEGGAGRHFDNFTARAASLPANIRLADYDYAKPALDVIGAAPVSANGIGEVRDSSSGSRFFSAASGARVARVRAEELRASAAIHHATGTAIGLAAGYRFLLEDHPRPALNKDYLVTEANHLARGADSRGAWGRLEELEGEDVYRVDVTAVSADLQYRHPSRTTWPRIEGYENGIIDGPALSDYAQIDEHGRYAVKFKFDEGTLKDGKASTFVRMMQPHAGGIEGWHFPQRKGTEVVFLFLGGDPDRPVIAGAIPNATTPSPVTSGNHTKNVIQTGGRNRLEIEDLAGQQRITLSTPHANSYRRMGAPNDDHELIAKTDGRGTWHTGGNSDFDIGEHFHVDVGDHKRETVVGAVHEFYKTSRYEDVNGPVTELYKNHTNTVDGISTRTVTQATTDTLTGAWTLQNPGGATHTIGTKHDHTVNGPHTLTVTGTETVETGAKTETTNGAGSWTLTGDLKVKAPNIDMDAPGGTITLKAPNVDVKTGWWKEHVEGPQFKMVLGGKLDVTLGVNLSIDVAKVGAAGAAVDFVGFSKKFAGLDLDAKAFEQRIAGLKSHITALHNNVSQLHMRNSPISCAIYGVHHRLASLALV